MSDDLVAFLTTCVDEDEAAARAVEPLGFTTDMGGHRLDEVFSHTRIRYAPEDGAARGEPDKAAGRHFARHDPARALAEVTASRLLLDHYSQILRTRARHEQAVAEYTAAIEEEERTGTWPLPGAPDTQGRALRREADYLDAAQPVLLSLVKAKAAIYSNRPGYRPEWKP